MNTHPTTHTMTHGPAPFVAAAAVVAAIAVGTVVVSHDGSGPTTTDHGSQQAPASPAHYHPTTSGGRVMIGMP